MTFEKASRTGADGTSGGEAPTQFPSRPAVATRTPGLRGAFGSTAVSSSARTARSAVRGWAASAMARASAGSDFPPPESKRTRATSRAGTSTTDSPSVSSHWLRPWPRPRAPWGGASVSSGLGSAGASIGHHASVNDVRESAFEAAQRLVPTLASGEFATEVAVAFGARHARLGERRDVERPVQLAVSTAAEAMALDLPARHLKRRRPRVAGVARARGSD